MSSGAFTQAVRDRVIPFNPAAETQLPKVVRKQRRILTPKEFGTLLEHIPDRWLPLVLTSIETGLRWGELLALRPRHVDWSEARIRIEETVLELSKRNSPTGQRIVFKGYPKDDEPRTLAVTRSDRGSGQGLRWLGSGTSASRAPREYGATVEVRRRIMTISTPTPNESYRVGREADSVSGSRWQVSTLLPRIPACGSPIDRSCPCRWLGGSIADGMSCPPRVGREHWFIRSPSSPAGC